MFFSKKTYDEKIKIILLFSWQKSWWGNDTIILHASNRILHALVVSVTLITGCYELILVHYYVNGQQSKISKWKFSILIINKILQYKIPNIYSHADIVCYFKNLKILTSALPRTVVHDTQYRIYIYLSWYSV